MCLCVCVCVHACESICVLIQECESQIQMLEIIWYKQLRDIWARENTEIMRCILNSLNHGSLLLWILVWCIAYKNTISIFHSYLNCPRPKETRFILYSNPHNIVMELCLGTGQFLSDKEHECCSRYITIGHFFSKSFSVFRLSVQHIKSLVSVQTPVAEPHGI